VSFLVSEEIGQRNYGIYVVDKKHTKVHVWPELANRGWMSVLPYEMLIDEKVEKR
jgi:hypothetical protein